MKQLLLLGILIVPLSLATTLTATESAASSAAGFEQRKEKRIKAVSQRLECIKNAQDQEALNKCSKQAKKHKKHEEKPHKKRDRPEKAPAKPQIPAQNQ